MNRHLFILYSIIAALVILVSVLVLNDGVQTNRWSTAVEDKSIADSKTETSDQSSLGLPRSKSPVKRQSSRNWTIQSQACPRGKFMTGIQSDGIILCEFVPGSTPPGSQLECYGHGFIQHGFCTCDEGWTGPDCENPAPFHDPDLPPDNDKDNHRVPEDCNDNDDMVYPGAPDSVDGKDNDCDGEIDEGY